MLRSTPRVDFTGFSPVVLAAHRVHAPIAPGLVPIRAALIPAKLISWALSPLNVILFRLDESVLSDSAFFLHFVREIFNAAQSVLCFFESLRTLWYRDLVDVHVQSKINRALWTIVSRIENQVTQS